MTHLRINGVEPRASDTAGLVYHRVDGSGDSIKDPKIMWLNTPTGNQERNQGILDAAREVAFIAKQRYIWIRSLDHSTTTRKELDEKGEWKKIVLPDHPHFTLYSSCDPDFFQLEGHAYLTYSHGSIIGLATEEELKHKYRGQNPLFSVYRRGEHVCFEDMPSRRLRDRRPPPEERKEFPWWRR